MFTLHKGRHWLNFHVNISIMSVSSAVGAVWMPSPREPVPIHRVQTHLLQPHVWGGQREAGPGGEDPEGETQPHLWVSLDKVLIVLLKGKQATLCMFGLWEVNLSVCIYADCNNVWHEMSVFSNAAAQVGRPWRLWKESFLSLTGSPDTQ